MVFSKGDTFYVKDLGSSNGTYVNGRKVTESPLAVGDKITVGEVLLTMEEQRVSEGDSSVVMEATKMFSLADAQGGSAAAARPKRLWVGGGAAVVALLVVAAWWSMSGDRPEDAGEAGALQPGFVKVAKVAPKELVFAISATGAVKPDQTVNVSAEVSGRLLEVAIDEGVAVEKGDVLATLNDKDIRLQMQEANSSVTGAQVELARQDYERKGRLFRDQVITRTVYEGSKNSYLSLSAAYQSSQARVQQLGEMLTKTKIVAPMSGIVVKKFVSAGEFVGPGAPVATLADLRHAVVELELPDRDVVKIRVDQPVEARADAFGERVFRGVIDEIGTTANPASRTFRVDAALDNADLSLKNGMIVSVRVVLEQARALIAPAEALLNEREGNASVFVIDQGRARTVKVRTGRRIDRDVEVLDGLADGQEVIVYGQQSLTDGQPVKAYDQ